MKKLFLLIFGLAIILSSCNSISDKSVSEKLNTEELSKAINNDTLFTSFYENIRNGVDEMDDIKKAKFNDVTYRRLFKYHKFSLDTSYWNPLYDQWGKEWEKEYGIYLPKVDSTLNYWKKYLQEKSLNKYVNVELAQIDKDYYEYAGEIKEVNLGFKLTPLQGAIDQLCFNYGYKAKINGDKYFKTHNCISTAPFSSPTIRYWEVSYSDRENFSAESVETFFRDYNLQIEITSIRKDGVNISTDDFNIPEEIADYFKNGENDTLMQDYYKNIVLKKIIYQDYLDKWEYIIKKANVIQEKEDKLCFDFMNEQNK